jgi:AraC-like DNA-binding protein
LLGGIQGILLALLLYSKKSNHTANVVLAAAIFALSLDVFHSAYIIFEYYLDFPHLVGITFAFPFLYGPVFYLYAKLISSNTIVYNYKLYVHFIPFILVVLYGVFFVYLENPDFKIALVRGELKNPLPGIFYLDYLKPIHGIIYVSFTVRAVLDFNKKIKNSFSNIEKINLNWLRHLSIGLSIIWFIVLLSYVVNVITVKDVEMDHLIYLAASVLIYSIGYLSLRQPQILTQDKQVIETEKTFIQDEKIGTRKSYQKSGLTSTDSINYLNKLMQIMETEKPFLNSDLTLQNLSELVSISTHNLSEIINTQLERNFYDFINSYRVKEVQRRLDNNDSDIYSILAIALESGFNSKSSFNTTFKKHTNKTPSQYRKQIK